MPVKLINSETIKDVRLKQNRADIVRIFQGGAKQNLAAKAPLTIGKSMIVPMTNANYVESEGYARLWTEIEDLSKKLNAAQVPAQSVIEALLGKLFIDVTRRAQEAGDLTSLFATEITDLDADQTMTASYFRKYIGVMGEVTGSNDSVNLIEQKTGDTDTFSLAIYALGWKDSLQNMLFNRLHDMQKVNQAAVDADTDRRNAATIGQIVGATFVATQKQAADATSGATFDVKTYNTLRKAIKKLMGLKDPKTNRIIMTPTISILCNSVNTWDLERVVNGQLTTGGANGTLTSQNLQALPVANIIEYNQGITNGFTYGKDTVAFPGVTAGKCYVFVPRELFWIVNKRPLTLETGMGSVLQLSTEERAWYRVFGSFIEEFLGSSFAGASGTGKGAIIEVTLPADS